MINALDYVELGLFCADICKGPRSGNEWEETRRPRSVGVRCDKSVDDVSWTSDIMVSGSSTYHALGCRTVAEIHNQVTKKSGRNVVSRLFHARNDEETIVVWKSELNRILVVFNVCSV
jgi:hypothetical protein